MKIFYWLSGLGLISTIVFHCATYFAPDVTERFSMILFIFQLGGIALFLPVIAVMSKNRKTSRFESKKWTLLRYEPRWLALLLGTCFIYGLMNLGVQLLSEDEGAKLINEHRHQVDQLSQEELIIYHAYQKRLSHRLSGISMATYSAILITISALLYERSSKRIPEHGYVVRRVLNGGIYCWDLIQNGCLFVYNTMLLWGKILLLHRTILCNHCYRLTSPFRSRYRNGKRLCEHCLRRVEQTKNIGTIILIFGHVNTSLLPQTHQGTRMFFLENPDCERTAYPLEISKIYLDAPTTNPRLFERFLTYIVNYPPKRGIRSVQIFYQGELDCLGINLKNTIQNTFKHIESFS